MPDVYALVRDLRQRRWSRNRHFHEHNTHTARRARGLHRFIDSLERDIRRATDVRLDRLHGDEYRLELHLPELRCRRHVALSSELLALLREEPTLAERLAEPALAD